MDSNLNGASSGSLEEQIRELRAQVLRLEDAFERYGFLAGHAAAAQPIQPPAPLPPPPPGLSSEPSLESPPVEAATLPSAPPRSAPELTPALALLESLWSAPVAPSEPERAMPADRSLESRIGSQWFNRIGILAMLIGMAWFLKLAVDNAWIGPLGRVLIGLVAGAGIVAWSERFQRKGYPVFAYSLKAVGSGILYLSLWAAFAVYHLIPSSVAFAAMIAVTAFNGFMAWIEDAELLALYAIVGGLSTPLLLSTGGSHEVSLFSYLALLDLAVLVLVVLRPWSRLLFMAFAGTVFFYIGWSIRFSYDYQSTTTTVFTLGFFLAFALAPRLIRVTGAAGPDLMELSPWDQLAALVMPVLNAALGFAAFYALFSKPDAPWAGAVEAVSFAAFYLILLRLPSRGMLRPNPPALANLHLATAIVFLTVAIPLKAHGRALTIGWLAEGAALLWASSRVRSKLLRSLALVCLLLGLVTLVVINPHAASTPFLNQRFGTYLVGIAAFAFAAWLAHQQISKEQQADETPSPIQWPALAGLSVLLVNLLALLALSLEIHNYWWQLHWQSEWPSDWARYRTYSMDAQFTYSALFMLYGGALLALGFRRSSAFLRWQALVLIAAAILKVFLADMSRLSQGYRVVSFLALGILLLAVSFVYQRDWLKLRPMHQKSADSSGESASQ